MHVCERKRLLVSEKILSIMVAKFSSQRTSQIFDAKQATKYFSTVYFDLKRDFRYHQPQNLDDPRLPLLPPRQDLPRSMIFQQSYDLGVTHLPLSQTVFQTWIWKDAQVFRNDFIQSFRGSGTPTKYHPRCSMQPSALSTNPGQHQTQQTSGQLL